ncbi:phage tail fiber protein [Aeromonas veronii]|uniref:phage tail fiber domain-containing protein n=1 Tax=Aeromonas veronii TaxID=654 RepID=UPI003B9F3F9C
MGAVGQKVFSFNFPYLKRGDISVLLSGNPVDYTFSSDFVIELKSPLEKVSYVEIIRKTKADELLINFNDVSELSAQELQDSATQLLYITQEAFDYSALAVTTDNYGNWDAEYNRIVNVADPIDDQDAVTAKYLHDYNQTQIDGIWAIQKEAEADAAESKRQAEESQHWSDEAKKTLGLTEGVLDQTNKVLDETRAVLGQTQAVELQAEDQVAIASDWANKSQYWYKIFRSIYRGARADAPVDDLQVGVVYFNTVEGRIYFYDGAHWISPTSFAERAEAAAKLAESYSQEAKAARDAAQIYSEQAATAASTAHDDAVSAATNAAKSSNSASDADQAAAAAKVSQNASKASASDSDVAKKAAIDAAVRAEKAAAMVEGTITDKGTWQIQLGYPQKPDFSAMWTITDGGEHEGIPWTEGDILIFSVTTGVFGRIGGTSLEPQPPKPIEFTDDIVIQDEKALKSKSGTVQHWLIGMHDTDVTVGDPVRVTHLQGTQVLAGPDKAQVFTKKLPPDWVDVQHKPETFSPSAHHHKWGDLTEVPEQAGRWPAWTEVTNKPDTYPPTAHHHKWGEIDDKPPLAPLDHKHKGTAITPIELTTEDLDSVITPAIYVARTDQFSTPENHYPEKSSGSLFVKAAKDGVVQEFDSSNNYKRWFRYYDGTTKKWSAWADVYNSGNKPTPADLGALPAASYIPRKDAINRQAGEIKTIESFDLNTANAGDFGLYNGATVTNSPFAGYFYCETKYIYGTPDAASGKDGALLQTAWPYDGTGDSSLWIRNFSLNTNTWGPWYQSVMAQGGTAYAGSFQSKRNGNPMYEWHSPGKFAWMTYLDDANNVLRTGTGNGAGGMVGEVARYDARYNLVVNGLGWSTAWPHTYDAQYTTIAPVHVDFQAVGGASDYYPIVRGKGQAAGAGFTTQVELGMLRAGNNWGQGVLMVASGEGANPKAIYSFDISGNFSAPLNGSFNDVQIRSDGRFKSKVRPIKDALKKLKVIAGLTYEKAGMREAGMIAQQVRKVLPEAITEREDGTLDLRPTGVLALVLQAVKELDAKVEALSDCT